MIDDDLLQTVFIPLLETTVVTLHGDYRERTAELAIRAVVAHSRPELLRFDTVARFLQAAGGPGFDLLLSLPFCRESTTMVTTATTKCAAPSTASPLIGCTAEEEEFRMLGEQRRSVYGALHTWLRKGGGGGGSAATAAAAAAAAAVERKEEEEEEGEAAAAKWLQKEVQAALVSSLVVVPDATLAQATGVDAAHLIALSRLILLQLPVEDQSEGGGRWRGF